MIATRQLSPALPRRTAFTLTEVLVVIAVIGVLVAIGLPALFMALRRSEEFRIQNRIQTLSGAIEAFKTRHGFYPPDFSRIKSADQFLPFLNRYAPNHNELALAGAPFAATVRRIDVWWDQVGKYLGPESALTFWLNGLSVNKQYPLTYVSNNGTPGNTADDFVAALPPYKVALNDATTPVERDEIFEFTTGGLLPAPITFPAMTITPPWLASGAAANTCGYSQLDDGKVEPLIYFEMASYRYRPADAASAIQPPIDIYPHRNLDLNGDNNVDSVVVPYGYVNRNSLGVYEFLYYNKESFQIIAPGVDGLFHEGTRPGIPNPTFPGDISLANRQLLLIYSCAYDFDRVLTPDPIDKFEKDNLGNGSAGRLDQVQQQNN